MKRFREPNYEQDKKDMVKILKAFKPFEKDFFKEVHQVFEESLMREVKTLDPKGEIPWKITWDNNWECRIRVGEQELVVDVAIITDDRKFCKELVKKIYEK